jgi:hypothetical protein
VDAGGVSLGTKLRVRGGVSPMWEKKGLRRGLQGWSGAAKDRQKQRFEEGEAPRWRGSDTEHWCRRLRPAVGAGESWAVVVNCSRRLKEEGVEMCSGPLLHVCVQRMFSCGNEQCMGGPANPEIL